MRTLVQRRTMAKTVAEAIDRLPRGRRVSMGDVEDLLLRFIEQEEENPKGSRKLTLDAIKTLATIKSREQDADSSAELIGLLTGVMEERLEPLEVVPEGEACRCGQPALAGTDTCDACMPF